MNNSSIKNYIYLKIEFTTMSGLCISSTSDLTQHDTLKTSDGIPYIPGSSIAGALRAYLSKIMTNKNCVYDLLGPNDHSSLISPLIVHHALFDNNTRVSIRDGIALDDTKQVKSEADKFANHKYDFEVIDPFQNGTLTLELIDRDNKVKSLISYLRILYFAVNNGDIRFGLKKTRGLGKICIDNVYIKSFGEKYKNLNWWNFEDFTEDDKVTIKPSPKSHHKIYEEFKVEAELVYGLNIRTYGRIEEDIDFRQLTVLDGKKEKPVIPGTSINGAIRQSMKKIIRQLKPLNNEQIEELLNSCLGVVEELNTQEKRNNADIAHQQSCNQKISDIIIDDAYLEDAILMKTVRTAINRFDGSTKDSALYTSIPAFKGKTTFNFKIPNNVEYNWFKQLLELVFIDMHLGYTTIGGETSIGRGIFKVKKIQDNEVNDNYPTNVCCRDLFKKLNSIGD